MFQRTILITAYAANPYKGSEDGTAWNIIEALARAEESMIVITRKNNRQAIERYLKDLSFEGENFRGLKLAYFDLPYWMRWWKKGERGALVYHYLWHLGVVFFILQQGFRFDIAHHLNFHSDWMPSFLWLLGKPFVWGPVGHHEKIPIQYLKDIGLKQRISDQLRWLVKQYFWKLSPTLLMTRKLAAKVLTINRGVPAVLQLSEGKVLHLPAIASQQVYAERVPSNEFIILAIGRFVPLKGFHIAIEAFAAFYHRQSPEKQQGIRLLLIGKGPEYAHLKSLVTQFGLNENNIQFISWMPQEQLWAYYRRANALLFPSFEGAGMVVPEAMAYGLPVICFDNHGPGETAGNAGMKIPYGPYESTIIQFADALNTLMHSSENWQELSDAAKLRHATHYTWSNKASKLIEIYKEITNSNSSVHVCKV